MIMLCKIADKTLDKPFLYCEKKTTTSIKSMALSELKNFDWISILLEFYGAFTRSGADPLNLVQSPLC
jgi:hypothetical protein